MKYLYLSKTGLKVSALGIGFWQAGSRYWGWRYWDSRGYETVREIVLASIEQGINLYDTAEIYGWGRSERFLGKAIRELSIRDEVVVVSKIAGFRYRYNDMLKAVKGTSKRLGFTPNIVLHHWPPPLYVPVCKVINNLEKLVDNGYIAYYGLSNYADETLVKALECVKKHEPVLDQLHYNLGYRVVENRTKKILEENKITLMAWSPLAKGALAGLTRPSSLVQKTDRIFLSISKDKVLQRILGELSRKYNAPKSAVSLSWLICKGALPVPGTRRPERIREYVLATKIRLNESDLVKLDDVTRKYLTIHGSRYNSLKPLRVIPGFLQHLSIRLVNGI